MIAQTGWKVERRRGGVCAHHAAAACAAAAMAALAAASCSVRPATSAVRSASCMHRLRIMPAVAELAMSVATVVLPCEWVVAPDQPYVRVVCGIKQLQQCRLIICDFCHQSTKNSVLGHSTG